VYGTTVSDTYRTVKQRASASFEVRGSEFIGHVAPADDTDAAEAFLATVRTAREDATHNVPAYRVPAGNAADSRSSETMLREYSSDDGEPTGSAGSPALNVLQQRTVRNVAAVVTRYYGGTNLGVGGLARAYARSVNDAVDAAGVIEEQPHRRVALTTDYDDSGTVRGILESNKLEFEAEYEETVSFQVRVPRADTDTLAERLRDATSGRVEID
jgi:uncharacterized YigZ family protein